MKPITLHEPSFAEAVAAIEIAQDLPVRTRTHWICSLRQIGKALDKPLEVIPARWTAARHPIARLHFARLGANPKTLANHKANARAALQWFGSETDLPRRGTPLLPSWQRLRDRLEHQRTRANLSSLMRYCSARAIEPPSVDEGIIDAYMRYRADTTALAANDAARRTITRAWNACAAHIAGWPEQRLVEPPIKSKPAIAEEAFPEGLRADIERYLATLTKLRRKVNGRRLRPCRPSTIRTRRAELIATARMAVRQGVEISHLGSLAALIHPDVIEKVIKAYWKEDHEDPPVYVIDLATKLLIIARQTGSLDPEALQRLDDIRAILEDRRSFGLTEKNLTLIRQVMSGTVWRDVLKLPGTLMEEARSLRAYAPIKAAVTAQMAVGIAILSTAPIRLGNLIRLRLDENLIKPGGPATTYMLTIPGYDVKNRVRLDFLLDEVQTAFIDEYVHHYRSTLLRGSNEPWLFPGESGGCKGAQTYSEQITQRIEKATGLRITVHQFRHAAAALWLRANPGEYEIVRQLLGHKNVQTTIQFYCGLETMQATRVFGEVVRQHMTFDPDLGSQA